MDCVSSVVWCPADDENDAVLFEKIKKGEYDADDPIWDNVSVPAKDLVVGLKSPDHVSVSWSTKRE